MLNFIYGKMILFALKSYCKGLLTVTALVRASKLAIIANLNGSGQSENFLEILLQFTPQVIPILPCQDEELTVNPGNSLSVSVRIWPDLALTFDSCIGLDWP